MPTALCRTGVPGKKQQKQGTSDWEWVDCNKVGGKIVSVDEKVNGEVRLEKSAMVRF